MDILWEAILDTGRQAAFIQESVDFCFIRIGQESYEISWNRALKKRTSDQLFAVWFDKNSLPPKNGQEVHWLMRDQLFTFSWLHQPPHITSAQDCLLRYYLPYAFLPIEARSLKRSIAITHFAQSLDGKIATDSGDSRWIGNEENLIHAHRMRALCDGIMIGNNTLINDQPALTVRKVSGNNPRRIVISTSTPNIDSLLESSQDPVLILGPKETKKTASPQYLPLPVAQGRIDCNSILQCLYKEGIHSVYIEGGATTTSYFLEERQADIVQLHISPLMFGSGISGIQLPGIDKVAEAISFEAFCFQPVGDTMMFIGSLKSQSS